MMRKNTHGKENKRIRSGMLNKLLASEEKKDKQNDIIVNDKGKK